MIFILDNYDSFTYNLYQYFGEIGEEVTVLRSNACTIDGILRLNPDLIVISPGPCTPSEAPFALEVIEKFKGRIPILGVCLGHEAIGQLFGGQVVHAKKPMHGKVSLITHDGKGVFSGISSPLTVARYHSLALDRNTFPKDLVITAQSEDGEIMGIRHKTLPIEGVQFHPEAILTEMGHTLLKNAVHNARQWLCSHRSKETRVMDSPWQIRSLECSLPPYRLVSALQFSERPFLLDSGEGYEKLGKYSFLGAFPFLEVTAFEDEIKLVYPEQSNQETVTLQDGKTLPALDSLLLQYQVSSPGPFPFSGGAVGFLSYDLKDEVETLSNEAYDDLHLPLWRFAWYDGIIVYDHSKSKYWLTACGINLDGDCLPELADFRLSRIEEIIQNYLRQHKEALKKCKHPKYPEHTKSLSTPTMIKRGVSQEEYFDALQKVIQYILDGDIYQANLTQRFSLPFEDDIWALYQLLHERNPAPFAAFLPYSDFQILCSSPERFLQIDRQGHIETRPIKGTRPRGNSPEEDQELARDLVNSDKDKAELTMIIDLERNDIGRLCGFGTVKVTDFLSLEKYPTVWHLVSTVSGMLKEKLLPSQILAALFPGGSITGAPKIRAMEIIEELEMFKRGVYTGSIGYISFDGMWDLNIVIRTILVKDGNAYVHAGGGIVADSNPMSEYKETIIKAAALFRVLGGRMDDE